MESNHPSEINSFEFYRWTNKAKHHYQASSNPCMIVARKFLDYFQLILFWRNHFLSSLWYTSATEERKTWNTLKSIRSRNYFLLRNSVSPTRFELVWVARKATILTTRWWRQSTEYKRKIFLTKWVQNLNRKVCCKYSYYRKQIKRSNSDNIFN